MKILAISGSLRKQSYNTSIIMALRELDSDIAVYNDLDKLPFFNPDIDKHTLEEDNSPLSVQKFRKEIVNHDAFIISTPEYAFEIPGVLKNALDWLVSSGELTQKPVAIISASTSGMGGDRANSVLVNLVRVLTGNMAQKALLTVSRVNKKIDINGKIIDKVLIQELKNILSILKENRLKENNV